MQNHEEKRIRNNQYLREFNDAKEKLEVDYEKFAKNEKIDAANNRMIEEGKQEALSVDIEEIKKSIEGPPEPVAA